MSAPALRAAVALFHQGRLDDAALVCEIAVQQDRQSFEALHLLGLIAGRQGRLAEAERWLREAVALKPRAADALMNLGITQERAGRFEDATASFRAAANADPNGAAAHAALGTRLMVSRRLDEAIGCFERAVDRDPRDIRSLSHLVLLRRMTAAWGGLAARESALLAAARAGQPGVLPYVLLAVCDDPAVQLAAARSGLASTAPVPFKAAGEPVPDRRLNIAYLSSDFRDHATAFLIRGMLELHDRSRFRVFAFSYGAGAGTPTRARIADAVDAFVDVRDREDAAIAQDMRRRGIDIAIDLSGRTQPGRLGILAARAAPVQVHYLGYPGTTGADFIDYFLADDFTVPAGAESGFSERIVRLPGCYQVNDRGPLPAAPTRESCGLPPAGFVFCCFNATYKIGPAMFDIWMRLLHAVSDSVLWLLPGNRWAAANLRREAAARGVAPDRLVFASYCDQTAHVARTALADLVLDTLPCNAHTTASDALWAGVPVVTCPGRSFAARVAGSLLQAAGLPELIAGDLAAYERLAFELARDRVALAAMRERLAAERAAAPLFDTRRTTRAIEAAYLTMWRIYCRGEPPRGFSVPAE